MRKIYIHCISPNIGSKKTQTHTYTYTNTYTRTHANNIYTHTTIYVEGQTHYFIHLTNTNQT